MYRLLEDCEEIKETDEYLDCIELEWKVYGATFGAVYNEEMDMPIRREINDL